jgi:hypothetical protein
MGWGRHQAATNPELAQTHTLFFKMQHKTHPRRGEGEEVEGRRAEEARELGTQGL